MARHQLDIIYNFPELVDITSPGSIIAAIGIDADGRIRTGEDAIEYEPLKTEYKLSSDDLENGRRFSFPQGIIDAKEQGSSTGFPISKLGQSKDGYPPLQLKLRTASDASSGNYEFPIVFTYETNGEIKQNNRQIQVHVNSRVEQLQPWATRAVILSAFIALASLVVSSISLVVSSNLLKILSRILGF